MKYFESYEEYDNKSSDTYWGDVGAGILCVSKSTKRILIALRSVYVNEPRTWGIIGGKIDDEYNENIKDGAIREFEEETGFKSYIKLSPSYIFKTPNNTFTYHNFLGEIENEFIPKLCWETEKYKWVSLEELLEINPKHFGLEGLLKNDLNTLKNLLK